MTPVDGFKLGQTGYFVTLLDTVNDVTLHYLDISIEGTYTIFLTLMHIHSHTTITHTCQLTCMLYLYTNLRLILPPHRW